MVRMAPSLSLLSRAHEYMVMLNDDYQRVELT
jgi:hypothetical protein